MPDPHLILRSRLELFALMLLVAMSGGCGDRSVSPGEEASVRPASYQEGSAEDLLASVFTRYRNAASYHDSAIVRMSYQADGRLENVTAPLRVWLNQRQLYVEAYDVRLWSDDEALTAWMNDPASRDYDSQVLRLPPIGMRPDLQGLLADPILDARYRDGIAGPAPQLDWLFSPTPMQRLFEGDHEIRFGKERSIERRPCVAVEVNAAGDRFRFWIDSRAGLIRRVDLPPVTSTIKGQPRQVSLHLELIDASFDEPRTGPDMEALPVRPNFVRAFVALPPKEPARQLGIRARPYRLTAEDASFTLSERGSDRPLTMLMRYSGDERSNAAVATLQSWSAMMSPPLREQVRLVVAVDESVSHQRWGLPQVLDRGGVLSAGYGMTPGSLVVLGSGGEVAWVQSELAPQGLPTLGAIVADVLDGVDVPHRFRQQWQGDLRDYRLRLDRQRIPAN